MTPKEKRFCDEFIVDYCAAHAAVRAGYSQRSAGVTACRLLKKPEIKARVAELKAEQLARVRGDADDTEIEIRRLAFVDPADYAGVKCPEDVALLPEDKRRAIVGWGWDRNGNFTLKFAKERGLEMLGRRHGLFKDKVEHSGAVAIINLDRADSDC